MIHCWTVLLIYLKGYITNDPGCACHDVETPHNVSRGWAAVVKYDEFSGGDCSRNEKVSNVAW